MNSLNCRWSKEEYNIIKKYYKKSNKEYLLKLLKKRNWRAIKIQASRLGVLRETNFLKDRVGLENLLKEIPEAYYWNGFIMADGSIFKREYKKEYNNYKYLCLSLGLAEKDKNQIQKFADFIKCDKIYKGKSGNSNFKNSTDSFGVYIMNNNNIEKISKKFDMSPRKTYHPSNLIIKNDDLFLAFIIGFIDGDGCIRKCGKKSISLDVVSHKNWRKEFIRWFTRLYKIANPIKINNLMRTSPKIFIPKHKMTKQNVVFQCSNPEILQFLKNKTKELKLPVLERKWNVITDNYSDRYYKSFELKNKIIKMLKEDKSYAIISKKLGITKSYVSLLWQKYFSKNGERKIRKDYSRRKNGKFISMAV